MNKKMLIILAVIIGLMLSALLVFWALMNFKTKGVSESLQEKIVDSNYATVDSFPVCKDNPISAACFDAIQRRARRGTSLQLDFISRSTDPTVNGFFDDAQESIEAKRWSETSRNISDAIDSSSELVNQYISDTKNDAKAIHDTLIPNSTAHICNYYIDGNWAVATLSSSDTDPANILLQKINNKWVIMVGPGTSFDPGTATSLGAPENIESHLQTIYGGTIVEYPGLTSTADGSTLLSVINALTAQDISSLELFDQLPIDTSRYSIRADYIDNMPTYIVTIYYDNESDKTNNQDTALSWFKNNDQDIKTIPIQYEYLQNSTDE